MKDAPQSQAKSNAGGLPAPPASAGGPDFGPELDEFAHIPARTGRPPLLTLGAAALALFLASQVRRDVAFALSPSAPLALGDARALAGRGADVLPLNRVVTLSGQPERESAVVLDTQGSWRFTQLHRLRGTSGKLFVRRQSDPLPVALAERDVFTGRLVRFDDLSFAQSIARHFAARVTATHLFAPAALITAAAAPPPWSLTDLGGSSVTIAPADRLTLDVARPNRYRIEIPVEVIEGRAKTDATAVKAALEAIAARITTALAGHGASVKTDGAQEDRAIEVEIPAAARDRALGAVEAIDRRLRFRPARDTVEVLASDITRLASGDGVSLTIAGSARAVPVAELLAARTRSAVEIPSEAVLLIEGETPSSAWTSLLALAFLSAFAAVNLVGFWKSVRRRPTASPPVG